MLSYIGGKSRIGTWIRDYIPNDIETYVEPFSGMYWVFYKLDIDKYTNLKRVVYNDFNKLNVNLFNCVRNYDVFYKVISTYESQNSEMFYKFQNELFNSELSVDISKCDYHIASKYVYLLTQVWSGTNPEKGKFIDLKGKYKSKFDSFVDKLTNPKWQKFFDKIDIVENLDFEEVIRKYDSESTYFYCDPPYYKTENYYSNHEFGIETHRRLSDTLKSISGKFSLSYYTFDDLEKWFESEDYVWEKKSFNKQAMAKKGLEQSKSEEVLIMNYKINGEQ